MARERSSKEDEERRDVGGAAEPSGVVKKREGDKEIRKMGESSPDLSLRLRQGSSDSRDSFYMDFAQVRRRAAGEKPRLVEMKNHLSRVAGLIARKDFE